MDRILIKCSWCGKLFFRQSNAQKYCSDHCKHESLLENKRKYINNRNKRTTFNTRTKNLTTLGSLNTGLGAKSNDDFDKEERLVRNELRRLGIV